MDELTAALASSFEVSSDLNKISAPHPRFSQFKMKSSSQDQDSRRQRLLEFQKRNRFDYLSHVRKLTEDDWKDDVDKASEEEEIMDIEQTIRKPGRHYQDQLMYSEWLVEVPSDFATEWLMVLCPVGKRCLVVTNKFSTKAYSKSGFCINTFPSHLPGGNHSIQKRISCCVLDCLYSEVNKTYYILDLMCWNGHSVYDTETEFRFFWLHEKIKETPEVMEVSKVNPMKFVPLPSFACTQEAIASAVASANFEIDGLLFYHKRTHYLFGSTPLVVWLKPYMLPEILGIEVPQCQLGHQPADYTNYADHMKKVAEDKERTQLEKTQGVSSHGNCFRQRRGRGRGRGHGRGRGQEQVMEAECLEGSEGGDLSRCRSNAKSGRKYQRDKVEIMDSEFGECKENTCGRLQVAKEDSAHNVNYSLKKELVARQLIANRFNGRQQECCSMQEEVIVESTIGNQLA